MRVKVGDRLACFGAILDSNIEGIGFVDVGDEPVYQLKCLHVVN